MVAKPAANSSAGIYLHIPFCAAICNYCNFNRGVHDDGLRERYVDALITDIAWQVVKEGHDVRYWIREKKARSVGEGFVPMSVDWKADAAWADVVVFDDVLGMGEDADRLRRAGKPVVGGTPYTDRLEDDRGFGQTELKSFGIDVVLIEPGGVRTPLLAKEQAQIREILAKLPERGRALYGATLERFLATHAKMGERTSTTPDAVAAVIQRALEARRLKTRYAVGADMHAIRALRWLLPDRAIDAVPPGAAEKDANLKSFLDGVTMTERGLLNVLDRHGIKRLQPMNEPFNPHLHEAVRQVPRTDVPAGTIVEIYQAGYTIEGGYDEDGASCRGGSLTLGKHREIYNPVVNLAGWSALPHCDATNLDDYAVLGVKVPN